MDNQFVCAGSLLHTFKSDRDFLQGFIEMFALHGQRVVGAHKTYNLIVMLVSTEEGVQKDAYSLLIESRDETPWYVDSFFKQGA